jgi:DNA-binding transcriptional MocR family regulator
MHPVRQLGPTGWAILQVLRERSGGDSGAVITASIRSLAGELGLAKNTVQHALRRLRALGLIEARQTRTRAGTFAAGHYVIPKCTTAKDRLHPGPSRHELDRSLHPAPTRKSAPSTQLTLEL